MPETSVSTFRWTRREAGHQVTPLELFFDLVFVFAITQVTSLLTHDATWGGVLARDARTSGYLVGVDRLCLADQRAERR